MTTFPFGETVTLHSRVLQPEPDADGNDVYTDTDYEIEGVAYWPAGSVETVQGRDQVTDQPTLSVPRESIPDEVGAILATDQITARGVRSEVDGKPGDYRNPLTGWAPPIVVRLDAVSG